MSSIAAVEASKNLTRVPHASRPSFFGIIKGEIFKARRMLAIWITMIVMLVITIIPYLISMGLSSSISNLIQKSPSTYFNMEMSENLQFIRILIGFVLVVLTANVFGRDYQLGTIRILLARGIGRVQLFLAKLSAVVILAIIILVLFLLVTVIMQFLLLLVVTGSFDSLKSLPSDFWNNTGIFLMTVLISMGLTILMTTTAAAIGRSMAFGLSVGLIFFPADNIGTLFMALGYELTHNDFWRNITAYFLGPNLNQMPAELLPQSLGGNALSTSPLVSVTGAHTLWVALGYAVAFAVISVVLTWKRDVKE